MGKTQGEELYDLVVVGAGPAGAVAARSAAERGLRVLLLERSRLPRIKPCAGAVSAKALPYLGRGMERYFREELRRAVFRVRGREAACDWGGAFAQMVFREEFDAGLAEAARAAGAELREGERVRSVELGQGEVAVRTDAATYRGRYLAGADGANGVTARQLGLAQGVCRAVAVEAEVARPPDFPFHTALVDYGCIPFGYGWAFPKGERLTVGVGTFQSGKLPLRRHFGDFARRVLPGTDWRTVQMRAHPIPLSSAVSRLHRGRALVLGDAGGLVDAFFGEGIYYAVRSGIMAAAAVEGALGRGGDLSEYQTAVEEAFGADLGYAAKVARYFYRLPVLAHLLMVERGDAGRLFLDVVAGSRSYGEFWRENRRHLFRLGFIRGRRRRREAEGSG
ncbi:MAG: geranylgeranyl reductase family protein [Thermaerobacter sp.]|nr:geranylgeranyl reductase family protein [Thermaerobacter sp.]